jgi:hypothetical protein
MILQLKRLDINATFADLLFDGLDKGRSDLINNIVNVPAALNS